MKKVDNVLEKFGLVRTRTPEEGVIERKLAHIYRNYEIKYPRSKEELLILIADVHTRTLGKIVIEDRDRFSQLMTAENVEIPFELWKLSFLYLQNHRQRSYTNLRFQFRSHDIKRMLQERLATNKVGMRREFPELMIKKVVGGDTALIELAKKKIRREVVGFVEPVNQTRIIGKIERELLQAMWQEYLEVREKVKATEPA